MPPFTTSRHPRPPRLALLFPGRCPICRAPGAAPCVACRRTLKPPPLLDPPDGLQLCASVLRYDDVGRRVVTAIKYHNHREAITWLAESLVPVAHASGVDVLTWAPTSRAHRRARGYDQAEVLARAIGAAAELPVAATLVRLPGAPQTGRSLADRLHGPRFDGRRRCPKVADRRVVGLVDDVVTSGATMACAAAVLDRAGAAAVVGLSAARTPRPG